MFFKSKHLKELCPLVRHHGIFRRQLTLFEAVALIVSSTIGAGVLGMPYAIAKVGIIFGLFYIIGLGILMIGYNLLIGDIAVRTEENLQLAGLARKYLGRFGELIMIILKYVAGVVILVIYIIGAGETLAVLLPGSAFSWSLIFFIITSLFIYFGLRTIKVVDFFLSLAILAIVLLIASFSAGHINVEHFQYGNLAHLLLPYGVILFAYYGGPAVLEAHNVLANRQKIFKSVIIIAGVIVMIVYALFTLVVLGVTGKETTEIATIGLGRQIGPVMLIFGNIFALLAMTTCYLTSGLSLRDSLMWDYKLKPYDATLFVCGVPLVVFLFGLRQFIMAMDIVGGIFISLEMLMVLLIYWRAKHISNLHPGRYRLHHTLLLAIFLITALLIGVVYSIIKLF